MTHMHGRDYSVQVPKMLKEAKSKLKKVLEAVQEDHEAIFELGMAHYYIPKFDISMGLKKHIISWKKAVKCFEKVGDKVPESYKGSNMLEKMQNYFRKKGQAVESSKMGESDDESDGKMENKKQNVLPVFRKISDAYKLDCQAAEIRDVINPNDAHNLRRWGIALTEFYRFNMTFDVSGEKLLEEAIEKFNEALLLEPDDINTKLHLARLHLYTRYDLDEEEVKDLSKESARLEADLSALISKVSPVVSGHVAAVSKECRRRIAQSQTPLFNLRSPNVIEVKNYNPHRILSVECPIRSGVPRLGIPAAAMQMRGMRFGGIRFSSSVAPILPLLLQQLITRK